MSSRQRLQVFKNPIEMNMNARTGTASGVTSTAIDVSGFSQLTLECDHVFSSGASVAFTIDVTDDLSGTPTWREVQSVSVTAGAATLSQLTYTRTTGADKQFAVNIPINYKAMRFNFTIASAHATSDTLTVRARLG